MKSVPLALLVTAMLNFVWKTIELRQAYLTDWFWLAAMIVAAIAIELVEFVWKQNVGGQRSARLVFLFWSARVGIIMILAGMRINADATHDAFESLHRKAFNDALAREQASIQATEHQWILNPPTTKEQLNAAFTREARVSDAIRYVEEVGDISTLAQDLDEDKSSPLPFYAPDGGYKKVVSMKVRISRQEVWQEWPNHLGDLVLAICWLLLPYALASIASHGIEALSSKDPLQGELFAVPRRA